VFCRDFGDGTVWIRFAESSVDDGESSDHIDIDLCVFAGSGDYVPFDPQGFECPPMPSFDIWWHEGGTAYANGASFDTCELTLVQSGDLVEGTFACTPLGEFPSGPGSVGVENGSFCCTLAPA
jgi:hypothetical protein